MIIVNIIIISYYAILITWSLFTTKVREGVEEIRKVVDFTVPYPYGYVRSLVLKN